jgi:hypothetical protein
MYSSPKWNALQGNRYSVSAEATLDFGVYP